MPNIEAQQVIEKPHSGIGHLIPILTSGVVIGLIETLVVISFGSLIFSGDLAGFLGQGIGLGLVSMVVSLVIIGVLSSEKAVVASIQDISSVVLALVAAGIAASAADPNADSTYYTVLAAMGLTSLLSGALMLVSSRFQLSGIVRALPYPVVGGLLAGTGWLLMLGGFDIATGGSAVKDYAQFEVMGHWLPGLLFAVILLVGLRRYQHFLLMPGLMVGAFVVFYAVVVASGDSIDHIRQSGYLLGPFPEGGLIKPLTPAQWDLIEWDLMTGEIGKILTIIVFSLILLILNVSGLELARRTDVDLNDELLAAGVANVGNGLFGGLIGFHTISLTILGDRMGAKGRALPFVIAAVGGLVLLAGTAVLEYVPTMVLGGLLIFLGASFLVEWCYDAYWQLPRFDYFVILLIVLTVALLGYIEGVGVGLVGALLLFAVDASRLGMIKHSFTSVDYRSKVIRPPADCAVLERVGQQVQIFLLQGFVFFGTANQLVERVRQRQADEHLPPLRFLILDLRQVEKMDSTALYSFLKLQQIAATGEIAFYVAAVTPALLAQLKRQGFEATLFSDVDLALEKAEDQLLKTEYQSLSTAQFKQHRNIIGHLKSMLAGHIDHAVFASYLQRQEVQTGQVLARQDESANSMFFVESGMLSVQLEMLEQQTKRIRTVTAGAIVGELAVYSGRGRSASIVVSESGVVYCLTRESLDKMQKEHPLLALAFHEYVAHLLAERLMDTTEQLEAALG